MLPAGRAVSGVDTEVCCFWHSKRAKLTLTVRATFVCTRSSASHDNHGPVNLDSDASESELPHIPRGRRLPSESQRVFTPLSRPADKADIGGHRDALITNGRR